MSMWITYVHVKQAFYIMHPKLPKDVLFCLYPLVTDVNIFLFEKQKIFMLLDARKLLKGHMLK